MKRPNALFKDTLREIWKTRNRFLSILAIVALGTGFFAGIKATAPDMLQTADNYYARRHLMDIRLISTIGFDEDDVAAVRQTQGISGVQPSYTYDLYLQTDTVNECVKAISMGNLRAAADYLNRPVVTQGKLPTQPGECAVDAYAAQKAEIKVGDTITLAPAGDEKNLDDVLAQTAYTVVGLAQSPMYVSLDRGNTNVGNGQLSGFVLLSESSFVMPVYTDLFITLDYDAQTVTDADYDTLISAKSDELESVMTTSVTARYHDLLDEAKQKIEDAQTTLDEEETKARAELADAARELEDGRAKIKSGLSTYTQSKNTYQEAIAQAEEQLQNGQTEIDTKENELAQAHTLCSSLLAMGTDPATLSGAQGQALIAASGALNAQLPQLYAAYLADPTSVVLKAQIEQSLAALSASLSQSDAALAQAKTDLAQASVDLETQRAQGKKQLQNAWAKLQTAQQELADGEQSYAEGEQELEDKLAQGRADIAQARKDLADIDEPSFYVLDRTGNVGYTDFTDDALRVDAIAKIFPVFFILIAALVCLTTMTRMVEEQRTQIGTLKALGYSRGQIMIKYILYAVLASLLGALPGLAIGFTVLPKVIYDAYTMMYTVPDMVLPFRWDYALWCTLAAMVCTGAAALAACWRELTSTPAALMRPAAPKAGKRVLLEKVTFLWNRLSFLQKVTVRNLLRYRKRLLMSVLGVAGCTALMVAGFGLKDSISAILDLQFTDIIHYDVVAALDADVTEQRGTELSQYADSLPESREVLSVCQETLFVSGENGKKEATVTVPGDPSAFPDYVSLQTRVGRTPLTLGDSGVIINEKLSLLLGVKVGDTLHIHDTDRKTVDVTITGITENYVRNYVYMTPALYEALYGYAPQDNALLIRMNDSQDAAAFDAMAEQLLGQTDVLGVVNMRDSIESFRNVMKSLDKIVLVLIIAAGSLAFIVLYNLTNINVTERTREIATLKVLGFYDNESSAYINRENIISSFLGMLVGLAAGVLLHKFVVQTSEVDLVMFGRTLRATAFLYAGVLTMVFTFVVNAVFHFKLKKIDMVESLKSIE
ncbi:MAG: ABC transporter permease [Eubacteriales bacterium]|nr:ABC transporter permease [Eubacteriales bacterium]